MGLWESFCSDVCLWSSGGGVLQHLGPSTSPPLWSTVVLVVIGV